jgi:hypothetical protein
MIVFHIQNLELFIKQYLAATILAVLIYLFLTHLFNRRERPTFPWHKSIGSSGPSTPFKWNLNLIEPRIILNSKGYSTSLSTIGSEYQFFSLLFHYVESGFPAVTYSSLTTRRNHFELFENEIVKAFFKIFLAVSSWEGLLFIFTPYKFLGAFIPHFSTDLNIIVALIMGISIFESSVSTVFFFLGISIQKLLYVELIVAAIFSASFLTPAMSWFSSYSPTGKVVVFFILLILVVILTFLISQLRTRMNLFKSAFSFSILSYVFFVLIIIFNLVRI